MLLGYNTNGMAHHDLFDAVALLGEIGYRSVAITIDHHALAPHGRFLPQRLARLRRLLRQFGMRSVIETGARFLLDRERKHEPTLVSESSDGRAQRIDFYRHAIHCAAELGSDCVSLWSGVLRDGIAHEEAMARLVEGLREVLEFAAKQDVLISALNVDPLTELSGSAGSGYTGTEIDLGSDLPPGETRYLDSVGVAGTDDGGSGASTATVYIMSDTGETPGASSKQLLVSSAIAIAGGSFADTIIPPKRAGFIVPAGGKLYGFVKPDSNTLVVTDLTARITSKA